MTLNLYQQIFSLSVVANAATTVKGGEDMPQEQLQAWMIATLPRYLVGMNISEWKPVYGPTVWTHPGGTGPDHDWFIARNPATKFEDGVHDTYVLAMAGTATEYGYEQEDVVVGRVVDFAEWMAAGIDSEFRVAEPFKVRDGTNAYISLGIARGASVILNTKAPAGTAPVGVGKTIVEFIATLPPSARLILTGHSLGSALCSTIACALKMCGKLDRLERTVVFPTAGFTPGNALFAQYFARSFPITPKPASGPIYQAWNSNIWNSLDVVPQIWSVKDPNQKMDNVIGIWPMVGWAKARIIGMVEKSKLSVARSRVTYMPLQGYSWTGGPPPIKVAKTKGDIEKNVDHEHVEEYLKLFGITIPIDELWQPDLAKFGLERKTQEEIIGDQPFLQLLDHVERGR